MRLGGKMRKKPYVAVLRELARAYQAFESYSSKHIRTLGLTPSQFDIVATLGNTEGMSFKELGEKTLITKGTLTGVVDRMVAKGLAQRMASPNDGRCHIVQLTRAGAALFERIFPAHLEYIGQAFAGFSRAEMEDMQVALRRLRQAISAASKQS
jgi:DNA-binding MarR family transcriptional regulator